MLTYDHVQGSANTTWTITHNMGTDAVAVDVFVDDGPSAPDYEKILPLTVVATDTNTITVTFSVAHTGIARVVGNE